MNKKLIFFLLLLSLFLISCTSIENLGVTYECVEECKALKSELLDNEAFAKIFNPDGLELTGAECRGDMYLEDLKEEIEKNNNSAGSLLSLETSCEEFVCDCVFSDGSSFMDRFINFLKFLS